MSPSFFQQPIRVTDRLYLKYHESQITQLSTSLVKCCPSLILHYLSLVCTCYSSPVALKPASFLFVCVCVCFPTSDNNLILTSNRNLPLVCHKWCPNMPLPFTFRKTEVFYLFVYFYTSYLFTFLSSLRLGALQSFQEPLCRASFWWTAQ